MGLSGGIESVSVSDGTVLSATDASGAWIITALAPFSGDRGIVVTINQTDYTIAVDYIGAAYDEPVEAEFELGVEYTFDTEPWSYTPGAGDADNDALLDEYVQRMIDTAAGNVDGHISLEAGSNLQGMDRVVYSALADAVEKIAGGYRTNSEIEITSEYLESSHIDRGPWTAAQLGVSAIVENGYFTQEAVDAASERVAFSLESVLNALLANYPSDLYSWIDYDYRYGSYSFRMPAGDVSVVAHFTPIDEENDEYYYIDDETFPDWHFRQYVARMFDREEGDIVTRYELDLIYDMQLYEVDEGGGYIYDDEGHRRPLDVDNLKGIELFTNLENLDCCGAHLYDLDLSRNTNIRSLYVDDNNLERLNLEGCNRLRELSCRENDLTELDLHDCTNLEFLNCQRNRLTGLDVSMLSRLDWFACCSNRLTELDVHFNRNLKWLELRDNRVRSLNVDGLSVLEKLNCEYNRMATLDIRSCSALLDLIDPYRPENDYNDDAEVR